MTSSGRSAVAAVGKAAGVAGSSPSQSIQPDGSIGRSDSFKALVEDFRRSDASGAPPLAAPHRLHLAVL